MQSLILIFLVIVIGILIINIQLIMEWWAILLIVLAVLLTIFIIVPILGGIIYRACTKKAGSTRLDGKTIIITGASAGIGKLAAYALAKMGARVILACRNLKKAEPIAEDIIKQSGNQNVVLKHLDVSNFESVRKFAAEINEEEPHLHVLLNNAGMAVSEGPKKCCQGFDIVTSTNHYGPFLLTVLLIGKIKASAPSRVVNVSSAAQLANELEVTDLNYENRSYGDMKTYCQSKLCNVLFTKELSKRLDGTGVTVNCLHPGIVSTEILSKGTGFIGSIIEFSARFVGKTPEQGAQTSIYLCHSEEVEGKSGDYYVNCRKETLHRKAADMALAKKLWDVTAKDVKLTESEAADVPK